MSADFLPNLLMKVRILALQVISADFERADEEQILLSFAVSDSAFNLRYYKLKNWPHDVSIGSSKPTIQSSIQKILKNVENMLSFLTRQTNFFCCGFLLHIKHDNLRVIFESVAKVALRFWCAKQSKNLERYIVGMSSKLCNWL